MRSAFKQTKARTEHVDVVGEQNADEQLDAAVLAQTTLVLLVGRRQVVQRNRTATTSSASVIQSVVSQSVNVPVALEILVVRLEQIEQQRDAAILADEALVLVCRSRPCEKHRAARSEPIEPTVEREVAQRAARLVLHFDVVRVEQENQWSNRALFGDLALVLVWRATSFTHAKAHARVTHR